MKYAVIIAALLAASPAAADYYHSYSERTYYTPQRVRTCGFIFTFYGRINGVYRPAETRNVNCHWTISYRAHTVRRSYSRD